MPSAGPEAPAASVSGLDPLALPDLAGVEAAAARLSRFLPETPLVPSAGLSALLGAEVWLKIETASPIASFKARGALNHLLHALDQGSCETAVTSSTGNHGQGVACAAALLELRSDIFLPVGSVAVKRRMIELFGGRVHEVGHDIDEAKEHARRFAATRPATFVDDGESFAMIEGAATVGLELARRLSAVDRVYVPMGSGVLASGVATAVKALQPRAEIVAVQSEGSPAMVASFRARRAVERPIDTFADCIVCRVPAQRALRGVIERVDDCRLVGDDALLRAMHTMLVWGHLLVEPGSAAALAGAYADRASLRGKRVVLIASGANVGSEMIGRALAAPLLERD